MAREESDGKRTPLTLPNNRKVKGSTLGWILRQCGIGRDEFLSAYRKTK